VTARAAALTVLKSRLEGITVDDGYATDAGQLVFIGEQPVLGPDDPEASVAIVIRDDSAMYNGENVTVSLPVEVQANVKVSASDPWATMEAVLGDIKQAVEQDHNLSGTLVARGLTRGSTKPQDREAGSGFIGVSVEYFLMFSEKWGAP
jgi:hypothetical protein